MATVYSLVCWGGRTGKTVSISASTDVVTLTKHGVRTGQKLWPSGTLPAELNSSTPVYGRATGIDTFTLHTSSAGAIANTGQITFAGSSTYSAVVLKSDLVASPATALSAYGLSDLSRWGASGSERIYDGIASWKSGRSGAGRTDVEVCEIGEAFTDIITSQIDVTVPSSASNIVSTINGKRSAGFHYGKFPQNTLVGLTLDRGYVLYTVSGIYSMLNMQRYRDSVDGITIYSANYVDYALYFGLQATAANCLIYCTYAYGNGIAFTGALGRAINNTIVGFNRGIETRWSVKGCEIFNNLITKCGQAFTSDDQSGGFFYNNIAIGNTTTQWPTPPSWLEYASHNYGPADNAWMSSGAVRYTIATTDFVDWANNDFRPASATSPQVDTALVPYSGIPYDIAGNVRPSYKGGAATEIDGGPYEFDHGYGPWPSSTTVTFQGIVAGSEIHIYDSAGNELVGVESCDANHALTWSIPANPVVIVTIIKRGLRWMKFSYTSEAGAQSLPIFQNADLGYNNPA